MRLYRAAVLAGAMCLAGALPVRAADAQAGRQKVAGVCQACHGMDGLSKNPESPNLAGQLEKLARGKDYRLVVCDQTGTNAFFLRHDVAPDVPGVSVATAYRPAIDRSNVEDRGALDGRSVMTEGATLVEV